MSIYVYICVYMCIYVYIRVYMCIYVYICDKLSGSCLYQVPESFSVGFPLS